MTATLAKWEAMLVAHGSDVVYHREHDGVPCPCRTPEGNRDPAWHIAHPAEPVCNELGILALVTEFSVKASVQPISVGGTRRSRTSELVSRLFPGEIRQDDHLGFFPITWNGQPLEFDQFSDSGEDFVVYDSRRFLVTAADKLPDIDGDPNHHWEVGMRLVNPVRVNA